MQADPAITTAAQYLARARNLCVTTGAGMSAESGVDTFRGADGLWARFKPEELATAEAFAHDPRKVWEWYQHRRDQIAAIEPHAGYHVLKAWESRFDRVTIVTQNIDGLHLRSGSTTVLQLHGRIDLVRCVGCGQETETLAKLGPDPRCEACGARLRPAVVWFGELLPQDIFDAAVAAVEACDVLLVIGTSGAVEPAASLVRLGRGAGAAVIEINPEETALSWFADVCLRAPCRDALVTLDRALA
jgi:NAD-dependent deacetylase